MGGGNSKSSHPTSHAPKLSESTISEAQQTGCLELVGLKLRDRLPDAACVSGVGNIREIQAGFNFFQTLPPNLGVFKNLETLRLEGNLLVDLSGVTQILGGMPGLIELGLNGNALEALPQDFPVAVSRLEKLELANNRLRQLPDTFGHLQRLEELSIMGNPMQQLPEAFGQLQQLEALDASCCELTFLPEEFTRMTRLMELNLSMNALEALPSTMGNMTRLVVLQLADNKLTDIPLSLGFCQCLESVSFARNPLQDEKLKEAQKMSADRFVLLMESRMQDYFTTQGIVSY